MPTSQSHPTLFLCLMLLAGLAGCGQASSDKAPSLESRASVGVPPPSKQGPSSGNNPLTPVTPAAAPVPLALGNETGVASGKETAPGGDNVGQGDKLTLKPVGMPNAETDGSDTLPVPSIPDSIAKDLGSPFAHTRYRALDHWETKETQAPLDPVFEAMEDEDEAVRAKATAIVEKYWAAEKEREKG